ncbi:MAG TPA: phosphate ABC transporter permease PstA [Anaeromyxobacter sp.]|jgi:phosphate transport system permease protein|nr:phosphate ABC transporter permease PstA [Anaeromyxobacter sp.]
MRRLAVRQAVNVVATGVCALTVVIALAPLASLLWLVVSKGAAGLSPGFFVHRPAPVGEPGGGVGPAIVGTFYMVGMACLVSLPIGIGGGVYLAERGDGTYGRVVRFTSEVLAGVPSIVLGVVAYEIVVVRMGRFSAIAGACALSLVMIPPLARATEEFVRLVPTTLREASLALGVPAWRTSLKVVLRTALGGIVTASLLAIARAAGETAPLLFTALNNQYWNLRPDLPTASLTVQIYNYAISPYESWHAQAWTAALVLLLLVGLLNLGARVASRGRLRGAR